MCPKPVTSTVYQVSRNIGRAWSILSHCIWYVRILELSAFAFNRLTRYSDAKRSQQQTALWNLHVYSHVVIVVLTLTLVNNLESVVTHKCAGALGRTEKSNEIKIRPEILRFPA